MTSSPRQRRNAFFVKDVGTGMIEKIGHVKNPLTIIAIFAGLAEVFGTLVLPLMDVSVQIIFVWFLMFFPVALVSGFFFLLWYKHEVLYAPSDFRSDDLFERIYRSRSPLEKIAQVKIENAQQEADEVESKTEVASRGEPCATAKANSNPESAENVAAPSGAQVAQGDYEKHSEIINKSNVDSVALSFAAEEIGAQILSQITGLTFDRNVSFRNSKYIYDAASISPDKAVVAEFKYIRSASKVPIGHIIRRMTEILARAYEEMPNPLKSKFEGVGVLLIDGTDSFVDGSYSEFAGRANKYFEKSREALGLSIPMKLHIFSMEDAIRNPDIKPSNFR